MCDPGAVSCGERIPNVDGILKSLTERQRSLVEPGFQRLSFQVLHHQIIGPTLLTHIEHGTDMRMA